MHILTPAISTTGHRYNLTTPDLTNVEAIDRGCLPMLHEMMGNGIWLNQAKCNALAETLQQQESDYIARIRSATGQAINPESGDQVAELLFDNLELHTHLPKLPKLTKSRKRYTTDDGLLSMLRVTLSGMPGMESLAQVVSDIASARECNTLRTTFAEPLPQYANRYRDGRVRTRYKYTTTRTGRLASEEPNTQNTPTRGDNGKAIRDCFEAHVPGKDTVLVSCDYSQIEMRVAAHMSGDAAMSRIFTDNLDIHSQTAATIFRVPVEQVDKRTQRLPAKTLGFGILYGVQGDGLQDQIFSAGGPWWTVEQCESLIAGWFDAYPGIAQWIALQHALARRYGYVCDLVGRLRWVPEARSVHERVRDKGFRECGNFPIQAGAQAVIKMAMGIGAVLGVVRRYQQYGVCMPLLQVHDELIFEVEAGMAQDFAGECSEVMAGVVELSVPVATSSDIGPTWGGLK